MSKVDEMINKSLDEIDAIVAEIKKGNTDGDLSKGVGDEDLAPDEVSEDAPVEDAGEEGNPDEGADDQPTGDDADVDADVEPEQDESEDEPVEKSLEDNLKGNDSVRKALEVSEFLDTLVKGISNDLLSQRSELSKSIQSTGEATELLAKSFAGIAKSQKVVIETQAELLKSLRTLNKRITQLESQPVVRKSVANAKPLEKPFSDTPAPTQSTQLTKSQVSAKLFEGVQQGKVDVSELLAFEGTGVITALSANAQNYVNGK